MRRVRVVEVGAVLFGAFASPVIAIFAHPPALPLSRVAAGGVKRQNKLGPESLASSPPTPPRPRLVLAHPCPLAPSVGETVGGYWVGGGGGGGCWAVVVGSYSKEIY